MLYFQTMCEMFERINGSGGKCRQSVIRCATTLCLSCEREVLCCWLVLKKGVERSLSQVKTSSACGAQQQNNTPGTQLFGSTHQLSSYFQRLCSTSYSLQPGFLKHNTALWNVNQENNAPLVTQFCSML